MPLLNLLIFWPKRIAAHFEWAGALIARIVVGYVFMVVGWGKLQNLDAITANFIGWGIPFPHILTPFVSGLECFGGLFLMLGLLTRISAGGLSITMIVAILSAKLGEITTFDDVLFFNESIYFCVFAWLAISGAGKASVDYWLERKFLN